jgi:cell division protein FtsN
MMNLQLRRRTLLRQQGSTLIGLIIGLVIGLVIAVIVALAITKGGTPFTDKLGKVGKTSEPATGQVSDPNQPMYGKVVKPPVIEPVPQAAQQPQPPQQDALQQLLSNLQPEPTAPKPAARPEPKPAAAPTSSAAAASAAPATAEDDKFVYYLQAGAFRNLTEAENTRARLALLGFEAAVTERSTDSGLLHRVRVGPFGGLDAMNRVRAKMTENGVDVAVVRNQKQNRE